MICDKCGLDFSGKLHLRETCLAEVRRLYLERAAVRDAVRIEARKQRLQARKQEVDIHKSWRDSIENEFEAYRQSCQVLVERINELEDRIETIHSVVDINAPMPPPDAREITWYQSLWQRLKQTFAPTR